MWAGRTGRAAGLALALLALLAAPAAAKRKTFTARYGPIAMGGFNVRFPAASLRPPRVSGFVVRMHARLVDRRGRPVTIRDVMLHHVIFRRIRRPAHRLECTGPTGEAFYSTGEEDETLRFPRGYGYRLRRGDRWRLTAMLMSHSERVKLVYVQYTVTVDTSRSLTPVHAFWLRANGCQATTSFPIPGGGGPGSTSLSRFEWRVPYNGRIVAAGGHLHGGAKDMWLSQPRCGDRRLLDTRPYYGMLDDLMYRVRPILHEPGPMDTRYFESATGIPIRAGETIALNAAYDNERPHWAVMATMHVYVARDGRAAALACRPLPADRRELRKPGPARTEPPVVTIPLSARDGRGGFYALAEPPWPAQPLSDGAVVDVVGQRFSVPHIALPAGAAVTWRFLDRNPHNLTFANGPRAVGSPTLLSHGQTQAIRFTVPGRYELFCSLHPLTMHEVVDVS
jgi:plastocyanin